MGCRKSAFEFHLNEMKRVARNNYSEFPYMAHESVTSKAAPGARKRTEAEKLASLVASAF